MRSGRKGREWRAGMWAGAGMGVGGLLAVIFVFSTLSRIADLRADVGVLQTMAGVAPPPSASVARAPEVPAVTAIDLPAVTPIEPPVVASYVARPKGRVEARSGSPSPGASARGCEPEAAARSAGGEARRARGDGGSVSALEWLDRTGGGG